MSRFLSSVEHHTLFIVILYLLFDDNGTTQPEHDAASRSISLPRLSLRLRLAVPTAGENGGVENATMEMIAREAKLGAKFRALKAKTAAYA